MDLVSIPRKCRIAYLLQHQLLPLCLGLQPVAADNNARRAFQGKANHKKPPFAHRPRGTSHIAAHKDDGPEHVVGESILDSPVSYCQDKRQQRLEEAQKNASKCLQHYVVENED